MFKAPPAGDAATTSAVLQRWREGRVVSELQVPKALQGPVVNDGYFASGAVWNRDESAVAYTAEVGRGVVGGVEGGAAMHGGKLCMGAGRGERGGVGAEY